MNRRNLILISLAAVAVVVVFQLWPRTPDEGPPQIAKIALHQEWFPYSGYAGEIAAVESTAQKNGFELEVIPGSESVDPIKLVLTGSADFGVVGGDLLIAAVAKGAPLMAIGVINHNTPSCFIVKSDSDIKKPSDFEGKTVGILSGTNTERVYEIMMLNSGVSRSEITEVEVPFDLQTFILGQYDVRPAFAYDEPVSLDRKEIPYRIIEPSDHAVRMIGTVYFCRTETIEDNPIQVQKLISALAEGWSQAIDQPATAVDALTQRYPDLDGERELASLKKGLKYFQGFNEMPLQSSKDQWEQSIIGLENVGAIEKKSVDVTDVWNSTFVRKHYENAAK